MGVNVMGVAFMAKAFVPTMQAQAIESCFCATASIAGIMALPIGVYTVSKFAAVSICEVLQKELHTAGDTHVSVHVLCPAISNTNSKTSLQYMPHCDFRGRFLTDRLCFQLTQLNATAPPPSKMMIKRRRLRPRPKSKRWQCSAVLR